MAGFAAIEARWKNEQPASEVLIAWPDAAERRNRFASSVPGGGRFIASGDWTVSNIRAPSAQHGTVLVRGPFGHFAEVHLTDPAMLSGVKAGDEV